MGRQWAPTSLTHRNCDHLYTWMASWGGQHGDAFRVDGGDMGTPLGFGAATRRMGDGSLGVVGQGGLGVA